MTKLIVRALAALLLAAALGALAGWLWWTWWGPANVGQVYDTANGPKWYDITADGLKRPFSGTAEYVVLSAAAGLVFGLVAGLLARGRELLFLAVLVVGAALGAFVTWRLGTWLGPDDPHGFETAANIGKKFPENLAVSGWSPHLAWVVGTLFGYLVLLLSVQGLGSAPHLSSGTNESEQPRSPAAS